MTLSVLRSAKCSGLSEGERQNLKIAYRVKSTCTKCTPYESSRNNTLKRKNIDFLSYSVQYVQIVRRCLEKIALFRNEYTRAQQIGQVLVYMGGLLNASVVYST